MKKIVLLLFLFSFVELFAQTETILLWKDVKSIKKGGTHLYVFTPEQSTKNNIPIIVCPGGSYAHSYALKSEGFRVAEWLNKNGFTAFVLKYRVGNKGYHHPAMIEDVQRAIHWVRTHSNQYEVDPDLLGVMGFSAGGHLSLMAATFYNENYLEKFEIENIGSLKPAFVVPVYPVVSMQDNIAHIRSRENLLGKKITQNEKDKFSIEIQVHKDMSPVFLVATKDDPVVDYQNSVVLDSALNQANVRHEFLLFNTGGHGFGVNEKKSGEAVRWKNDFKKWLIEIGLLN